MSYQAVHQFLAERRVMRDGRLRAHHVGSHVPNGRQRWTKSSAREVVLLASLSYIAVSCNAGLLGREILLSKIVANATSTTLSERGQAVRISLSNLQIYIYIYIQYIYMYIKAEMTQEPCGVRGSPQCKLRSVGIDGLVSLKHKTAFFSSGDF